MTDPIDIVAALVRRVLVRGRTRPARLRLATRHNTEGRPPMTAEYTNLIRVPGLTARVVVDADYDWHGLGRLLAEGTDHDQAQLIEAFARELRSWPEAGSALMQVHYISDLLKTPGDEDYTYDLEAVKWFLRELLIRLETNDD